MELQHLNIKIFAEPSPKLEREKFTPVFQGWIQRQYCDELLIDVADYLHVPAGPGIVLIGYEADYFMDETDQRLGLRYNRKTALPGENRKRFAQALKAALQACLKLEKEPLLGGNLRFDRKEIELLVNDRALAPNTSEIRARHEAELKAFFDSLYRSQGIAYSLQYQGDPRARFGLHAKAEASLDFEKALQGL